MIEVLLRLFRFLFVSFHALKPDPTLAGVHANSGRDREGQGERESGVGSGREREWGKERSCDKERGVGIRREEVGEGERKWERERERGGMDGWMERSTWLSMKRAKILSYLVALNHVTSYILLVLFYCILHFLHSPTDFYSYGSHSCYGYYYVLDF